MKIHKTSEPERITKRQIKKILRNSWEQILHANENTGTTWKA